MVIGNSRFKKRESHMVTRYQISWNEVQNGLKKMKNNKLAGQDEPTVDKIKAVGPVGVHWLTRLFRGIGRKGRILDKWGRGEIRTEYKKGSKRQCKNYRLN